MNTELRSSALVLVGLGLVASPLFAGCGGDETTSSGGGTTTTTEGGGGTTGQGGAGAGGGPTGGGGTGGTTTTGGGGAGGTTTTTTTGIATGDYDCSPADGPVPAIKLTQVASGLNSPVLIRPAPGDNERLFIVEKTGRIRILKDGAVLSEPFLDISDKVINSGERGLLGLAFHPKYQENGRFFVFYTDKSTNPGDQIIAEYARSDDPDLAVAGAGGQGQEVQILLDISDSESNHNGGALEFSPLDGYLYIGLGDEGGGGDNHGPFGNGLNLATLWGKIARIDVDKKEGGKNYAIPTGNTTTIPAGNPSTGAVLPEIWDHGLRNPWRIAFDPCTADLYIGDVGQGQREEIDVEPAGKGNNNYGWKAYEGTNVFNSDLAALNEAHVLPVAEYSHAAGNCSVTGGYLYRGSAIPGLRGRYFYGDYCSGKVWSFAWDGTLTMQAVTEHTAELGSVNNLTSFGHDNLGNVYVVRQSGTISRIDAQ